MKSALALLTILVFLFAPALALGDHAGDAIHLNLNYPSFGGFDLNEDQNLNQLIAWLYYFLVGIAGFAAFIMLVWGGIQWLTSSGNPGQIEDARDRIKNALLGLLLVLSSFLILRLINPELTVLNLPQF